MSDLQIQDHEVVRPGMRKEFQQIDREVWLWSLGKTLTKRQIQEHAIATFEKAGITTFKASDGWYRRWLARWGKKKEAHRDSDVTTPEKTDSSERLYNDLLEQLLTEMPTTSQNPERTIFSEEDCTEYKIKCPGIHDDSDCPSEDPGDGLMKQTETQDLAETSGLSDLITKKSVLAPKKKIERYLPQFKTKVVMHALKHSIKDAVYAFKVNKSTIADWIREENEHNEKVERDTQIEVRPDLDFVKWLQQERKSERLITKDLLLNKFIELTSSRDVVTKKAQWFYKYVDRFADETSSLKTHIMYPANFKRELAKMCGKWSKKTIGRIFNIDRKRISSWAEHYSIDNRMQLERQVSSYLTDDKIDAHVWKWYVNSKPKPSSKQIREKAVKLYRRAGYNGISCSSGWYYRWRKRYMLPSSTAEKKEFDDQLILWVLAQFDDNKSVSHAQLVSQGRAMKGAGLKLSSSWVVRFLKRHSYLMQKSPGYQVKLPGNLEGRISEFQNELMNTIVRDGICLSNVLAFDEVPLNFSTTGSHQPKHLMRKSGFDNCHASLILVCSADGTLHPTTLILKSQDVNDEVTDGLGSSCVNVQYQSQGIADSAVLNRWFQEMLRIHEGPCIYICDSYTPHKGLDNVEAVLQTGSRLMIIPDGCSSRLLPITFGLSEEFKKALAFHWEKWLHRNSWGKSNGVQLPLRREIVDWVSIAHEKCSEEIKDAIKDDFSKILNQSTNEVDFVMHLDVDTSLDFG